MPPPPEGAGAMPDLASAMGGMNPGKLLMEYNWY